MSDAAIHAALDGDGRLISADAAFAALNARAGGEAGRALATPQLATAARLATRLGIAVSRHVTIADGERDVDLWLRAVPTEDGVALTLSDLSSHAVTRPGHEAATSFVRSDADWTWETDGALRLSGVSAAAGVTLGFDASAVLGRSLTSLFQLATEEDGALPILEAVAQRRDFDRQRARVRESGAVVELSAVARRDASGGFAGFVGGARSVAEPPIDTAPGISVAFASRLDAALRGPLAAIVANADSIGSASEGPLGEDYIGYAGDIASAGRHLLALVDDLVDLEAIEREDFATEADAIDLADLSRRAAGLFAVRASDADVAIDRPGPSETAPATGEFRRALQILVNLIGNAIRYAPRGSTVNVVAVRDGGRSGVIVGDAGKGIPADDQERIFEKFGRIDPGEVGGSGLGLYIARRLARAMGGDLTVDSAPGRGARFLFTLPAG